MKLIGISQVFWAGLWVIGLSGCASQGKYDELAYKPQACPRPQAAKVEVSAEAPAETGGFRQAEAVGKAQTPKVEPGRRGRLVVYDAVIHIVVERINDSLNRVKSLAGAMDGYMLKMETDSITVKVPANRFQEALAEIERLGEVTQRDINGVDVTEEMRDLRIRLKNAELFRERLLKILDKAGKIPDALKVEQELQRVTETIEMLKGKIQYLENSVAFSTITVRFNSPIPQKTIALDTPFPWVHQLAGDMGKGTVGMPFKPSMFSGRIRFDLPEGYLTYFENEDQTRAMSADRNMILVMKHENYKGGTLEFWSKLIRRALADQKAIAVKEEKKLKLNSRAEACLIAGSKEIGGKPMGYLVMVATDKQNVYTVEAWGAMETLSQDRAKLDKAMLSLGVGP